MLMISNVFIKLIFLVLSLIMFNIVIIIIREQLIIIDGTQSYSGYFIDNNTINKIITAVSNNAFKISFTIKSPFYKTLINNIIFILKKQDDKIIQRKSDKNVSYLLAIFT